MKTDPTVSALLQTFLRLETEEEVWRFVRDLLTEEEIREFARRWQVAQLLAKGLPYSQIEQKTNMSSTTIARVSKFLRGKWGGYQLVLDRMHHHSESASPAGSGV